MGAKDEKPHYVSIASYSSLGADNPRELYKWFQREALFIVKIKQIRFEKGRRQNSKFFPFLRCSQGCQGKTEVYIALHSFQQVLSENEKDMKKNEVEVEVYMK